MIDTKVLREKVLDLAIRGKLVPQDPNDEPASVLLERIRAEKQQMVKDGKLKAKDIKNDTVIFKGDDNLHYEQLPDGTVKCIEDEIPFNIPASWMWTRIASISEEIFAGGDKPANFSKEQNEECPYAIYSNGVEKDGLYGFTDIARVIKPSITVSGRGTIGFSCVRYVPFFPIVRLITITPSPLISLEFLDFVFKRLLETGTGSSIPQLTVPMVKPKLIPIPPLNEQKKIVITATNFFEQIEIIDEIGVDLLDTISIVKSKILDLAIRGKLVPQNPNDEPASVLLERIRAEKEEMIKQGKIKRDKKESVIFKGDDNSYYEKIGDEITCIDNELPFEIPDSWCWARLYSLTSQIFAGGDKPVNYSKEKTEFYPIPIYSNGVENDGLYGYTDIPRVSERSLTISARGTIGFACVRTEPFVPIIRLLTIIPIKGIDIEFLKLVFQFFIESGKGSSIPQLTVPEVKPKLIPVPSIEEQRKIAQAVKNLFVLIESIKASLS